MNSMQTVYIYALREPSDGMIFYVGKSKDPSTRYRSHFKGARQFSNRHLHERVHAMRERGEKPLVTILEVCSDNWRERERYWISYFRLLGVVLENITAGGDGATFGHRGPFRDTEARRLRLRKGWQEWWDSLTAEERKKSTSHKMSEEMKAKLSRERKGIPQSLEHRQAVVASKRTPEYHAKASSSQRQPPTKREHRS